MNHQQFTCQLMQWHSFHNKRKMPWTGEKNPYKIWLSEVILQQTRVEQGRNYYEKFLHNYPTIQKLAKAKDEEVFKLWEGLGYYNRCKNLLHTSRYIATARSGKFPTSYIEVLSLKGVGTYTAAAICSFAYNLPYAVVDGNVFRVLSRVFAINTPIDNSTGIKKFTALAQKVLDKKSPGAFNQAIMDFGATVCKPFAPLCTNCYLQKNCKSYKTGQVNMLPVKEKIFLKKNRWLTWFILKVKNKILVHKRMSNDIWQNLFEFYLLENSDKPLWNEATVKQTLCAQFGINEAAINNISPLYQQQLTHQKIKAQFVQITLPHIPPMLHTYQWLSVEGLTALPFPKIINQYLQQNNIIK